MVLSWQFNVLQYTSWKLVPWQEIVGCWAHDKWKLKSPWTDGAKGFWGSRRHFTGICVVDLRQETLAGYIPTWKPLWLPHSIRQSGDSKGQKMRKRKSIYWLQLRLWVFSRLPRSVALHNTQWYYRLLMFYCTVTCSFIACLCLAQRTLHFFPFGWGLVSATVPYKQPWP